MNKILENIPLKKISYYILPLLLIVSQILNCNTTESSIVKDYKNKKSTISNRVIDGTTSQSEFYNKLKTSKQFGSRIFSTYEKNKEEKKCTESFYNDKYFYKAEFEGSKEGELKAKFTKKLSIFSQKSKAEALHIDPELDSEELEYIPKNSFLHKLNKVEKLYVSYEAGCKSKYIINTKSSIICDHVGFEYDGYFYRMNRFISMPTTNQKINTNYFEVVVETDDGITLPISTIDYSIYTRKIINKK